MNGKFERLTAKIYNEISLIPLASSHDFNPSNPPMRAIIEGAESPDGRLRIIIPAIREWAILPFLLFWLAGWSMAIGLCVHDVFVMVCHDIAGNPLQAMHGSSLPRLLLSLPLLLLFGAPVLFITLLEYFGCEVVTLYREELCYERRIGKWRIAQWRVNHKRIVRFCAAWERDGEGLRSYFRSKQNRGRCDVSIVRSAGQDRRFGLTLNTHDREMIVNALNERLAHFSATPYHALRQPISAAIPSVVAAPPAPLQNIS